MITYVSFIIFFFQEIYKTAAARQLTKQYSTNNLRDFLTAISHLSPTHSWLGNWVFTFIWTHLILLIFLADVLFTKHLLNAIDISYNLIDKFFVSSLLSFPFAFGNYILAQTIRMIHVTNLAFTRDSFEWTVAIQSHFFTHTITLLSLALPLSAIFRRQWHRPMIWRKRPDRWRFVVIRERKNRTPHKLEKFICIWRLW